MKVTIDFEDSELQAALQAHLDGGPAVRTYVRAAVAYFNKAQAEVAAGRLMGSGDARRFKEYNTVIDPAEFMRSAQ